MLGASSAAWKLVAILAATLLLAGTARADDVTFAWLTIGAPGNAPDDEIMNCCEHKIGLGASPLLHTRGWGSVATAFRISQAPVSADQWAAFLNAVARDDPHQIFRFVPDRDTRPKCGVERFGQPGDYSYAARPGLGPVPMVCIGFMRAMRFVNWLHNGQPVGPQDDTTTEDGAYDLDAAPLAGFVGQTASPVQFPYDADGRCVFEDLDLDGVRTPGEECIDVREPDARFWIPTEDQLYKALYHDRVTGGYFDYGTASNSVPIPEDPPGGPNSAHYCVETTANTGGTCPYKAGTPELFPSCSYVARSAWGLCDGVGNVDLMTESIVWNVDQLAWWMAIRSTWYATGPGDNSARGRLFGPLDGNQLTTVGFHVARPPGGRACGLGFELALLLAPLVVVARRRARGSARHR